MKWLSQKLSPENLIKIIPDMLQGCQRSGKSRGNSRSGKVRECCSGSGNFERKSGKFGKILRKSGKIDFLESRI